MSRFVRLNMNPELNDDHDCTIRAICLLLDKSWDEVYLEVCAEGLIIRLRTIRRKAVITDE